MIYSLPFLLTILQSTLRFLIDALTFILPKEDTMVLPNYFFMTHTKFTPLFILLIASTFLAACSSTWSNTVSTSNNSTSVSSTSTNTNSTTSSKTVSYRTDHGKHSVSVTFDIATGSDGIITGVQANMNSGDHESAEYIARFNNASSRKIIGQKISSLSLSSVGGARDTTDAFLETLASL